MRPKGYVLYVSGQQVLGISTLFHSSDPLFSLLLGAGAVLKAQIVIGRQQNKNCNSLTRKDPIHCNGPAL